MRTAQSPDSGKDAKKAALAAAGAKHVELARAAAAGLGVDRHLTVMKKLATEDAQGESHLLS
jgi:Choline/Carnitine o-acyltransferase